MQLDVAENHKKSLTNDLRVKFFFFFEEFVCVKQLL